MLFILILAVCFHAQLSKCKLRMFCNGVNFKLLQEKLTTSTETFFTKYLQLWKTVCNFLWITKLLSIFSTARNIVFFQFCTAHMALGQMAITLHQRPSHLLHFEEGHVGIIPHKEKRHCHSPHLRYLRSVFAFLCWFSFDLS